MIQTLRETIRSPADREGQALVEYALILTLVTVFALGALSAVSTNVGALLNEVATLLTGAL